MDQGNFNELLSPVIQILIDVIAHHADEQRLKHSLELVSSPFATAFVSLLPFPVSPCRFYAQNSRHKSEVEIYWND